MPVIAVVAPPGYGKTTLLAQFAAAQGHRGSHGSRPTAATTTPSCSCPTSSRPWLASPGLRSRVDGPPRLASAIAAMQDPMTLIIDHFESVTNWESWDVVAAAGARAPAGLSAGDRVAGRVAAPDGAAAGPRRPVRGRGRRAGDGRGEEAAALLSGAGVEPAESELGDLVAHTEGWPTGLYLAALAARAGGSPADAGDGSPATTGSWATTCARSSSTGCRASRWPSSPARRSSSACAVRSVTPWSGRTARPSCSSSWSAATCWSCRSTVGASGTGTTTCSGSCCMSELRRREPEVVARPAPPGGGVVRGERPARGRHRARPGRRRRRPGRRPRPEARQPRVGERTYRHRAALDGVVRGRTR